MKERAERPLHVMYADPPYPGLARRYYGAEPEFDGEVDHVRLLEQLATADAWALSTSATALPWVLSLLQLHEGTTPPELRDGSGRRVRVAVWKRGHRPGRSRGPLQSWEPVVYAGGRQLVRSDWTPDTLDAFARPRTTDRSLIGSKPAAFWWWLFDLLDVRPGDQFEDVFTGTGGGERAFATLEASSADRADASSEYSHDGSTGQP